MPTASQCESLQAIETSSQALREGMPSPNPGTFSAGSSIRIRTTGRADFSPTEPGKPKKYLNAVAAFQFMRLHLRALLDESVPFEVVHYLPRAGETMIRLPGKFHMALQVLAESELPQQDARVLPLVRR